MATDYLSSLKYYGLISRIKRLSDTSIASGRKLYQQIDIGIEPNWYLVFKILMEKKQTSISELSTILKFTHPSVITIVQKMNKAGYLIIKNHATDKRKQIICLSEKAHHQLPEMEKVWDTCEKEMASIFTNDSFINELSNLESAFEEKSFASRVLSRLNKKEILITAFQPKDASDFANLNKDWIRKYFKIEPIDRKVLDNPIPYIINKKGRIFMALYKNNAVGTVALQPKNKKEIELCKMAVDPSHQKKGIGFKLIQKCIAASKELNYQSLILYSNTKLVPAINLYKKCGFKEVALEKKVVYVRTNIKMELKLKDANL